MGVGPGVDGARRRPRMGRALAVFFVTGSLVCCASAAVTTPAAPRSATAPAPHAADVSLLDGALDEADVTTMAAMDAAVDADATLPFDDPMALHLQTSDELRRLMDGAASVSFPVGGGPWRFSQGNRTISRHSIGPR